MIHGTEAHNRGTSLFAAVLLALLARTPAEARISGQAAQSPETLCKCSGSAPGKGGGLRDREELDGRYRGRFKSKEEADVAWRVYQAVNRCDAGVVLGRLSDTGGFQDKPGYCVLRTLESWVVAINDVFLDAGIDRRTPFLLVSIPPAETMARLEDLDPQVVAADRETYWKVIYNHEICVVDSSGKYRRVGEADSFSPQNPGRMEPKDADGGCPSLAGTWSGSLVVQDVSGTSNVTSGQKRNAKVEIEQKGCTVVLKWNTNAIRGVLASREPVAELVDRVEGALRRARLSYGGGRPARTDDRAGLPKWGGDHERRYAVTGVNQRRTGPGRTTGQPRPRGAPPSGDQDPGAYQ